MNNIILVAFICSCFTLQFSFAQNSLICDRHQTEYSQKKLNPEMVIQSAAEIFQHFYQNPQAMDLPPYEFLKHGELKGFGSVENLKSKGKNSFVTNLKLAQNSQYYLNCKHAPLPSICQTPPSYIWGGMGWYEKNPNGDFILNLHSNDQMTNRLAKHPGLDCSGFIYAVYANAKLRVTTDLNLTPSFDTADNTPARSYMDLGEKSCFREVVYSKQPDLELSPGDIIAWKTHMLILNSIGSDPLGINHITDSRQCTIANIKPEMATMTVLNSKGGFGKHSLKTISTYSKNSYFKKSNQTLINFPRLSTGIGMGISKQYVKEFFYTSPKTFFDIAINFCKAKFNKVNSLKDVKLIRHKAFFNDQSAPCACYSREQDYLELQP